jgi:hypothetical protein
LKALLQSFPSTDEEMQELRLSPKHLSSQKKKTLIMTRNKDIEATNVHYVAMSLAHSLMPLLTAAADTTPSLSCLFFFFMSRGNSTM